MNNDNDALIGKIYETALSPGDWVELLDTIAGWTDAQLGDALPAGGMAPASECGQVESLVAHLERAVRSSSYMHALEDRSNVLNAMYNQMPWPMLMLGEGLEVLEYNPVALQVLAAGPVRLVLLDAELVPGFTRQPGQGVYLELAIADLDRLAERLSDAGVAMPVPRVSRAGRVVSIADPEGNLVSLIEEAPGHRG